MTQLTNTKYDELMQYINDDTILGDLARDAKRVRNFPQTDDWETVEGYLEAHGACDEALDIARAFWKGEL